MFILMMLIAIPERIFIELGINPEKISILPFLLVWFLIFLTIYLLAVLFLRTFKYMLQANPFK